jgi:hypothetical protein
MTSHAPFSVWVVPVPVGGSESAQWRRDAKPRYPRQPRREAWRPAHAIPHLDPQELRRRVAEVLDANREQRRQALETARAALAG